MKNNEESDPKENLAHQYRYILPIAGLSLLAFVYGAITNWNSETRNSLIAVALLGGSLYSLARGSDKPTWGNLVIAILFCLLTGLFVFSAWR